MDTLQELVRYCNEEHHIGALMLTGEWGCGKTYLIEKALSEALSATHYIVRVSLLGVDSIEALNDAVRKQWLLICTPFLGRLQQEREKLKKGSGFFSAIGNVLQSLNPVGGSIASAIVAVDPLEYIPLEPVVEDLRTKGEKRRVVLIFDDLSRTRMDINQLVGSINEYCENMGFTTIVVAEESSIKESTKNDPAAYKMIKEKTIARTLRYIPDYQAVIQSIISSTQWPTQEYADYLDEKQQVIYDVFVSNSTDPAHSISKFHNFRSLSCALHDFFRLYQLLTEQQAEDIDQYLYSFITYILVSRNGIYKTGKLCFNFDEEDIKRLYPDYNSEILTNHLRQWIEEGIWEEELILQDICDHIGSRTQEDAEKE